MVALRSVFFVACLAAVASADLLDMQQRLFAAVESRMSDGLNGDVMQEIMDLLKQVESSIKAEAEMDDSREEARKVGCTHNVTTYEEALSKFKAGLAELPTPESFQATLEQLQSKIKENIDQEDVKERSIRKLASEMDVATKQWQSKMDDFQKRQEKHVAAFKTLEAIQAKLAGEEDRVAAVLATKDSLTTATSLIEVARAADSAKVSDADMGALAQYLSTSSGAEGPIRDSAHKRDLSDLVTKLKTTLTKSMGVLKDTYTRSKGLHSAKIEHQQDERGHHKTTIAELKKQRDELKKKVFSVGEMAARTMNTRLAINGRVNTTATVLDATKVRCALGLRTYEHQVEYRKKELGIVDQVKDYILNEMKEHADLLNAVAAKRKTEARERAKEMADISVETKKIAVAKEKATILNGEKSKNEELTKANELNKAKLASIQEAAKAQKDEEVSEKRRAQDEKIAAVKRQQDEDLAEQKSENDLRKNKLAEEADLKKQYAKEESDLKKDNAKKDEEATKKKLVSLFKKFGCQRSYVVLQARA